MREGDPTLAKLFIPIGLLLSGWLLMCFLARRNERKIRSEWEGLLRDAEDRMLEAISRDSWAFWTLLQVRSYSWAKHSKRTILFSRAEIPEIIWFVGRALFHYLPVRCWVCHKLIFKNVKYRKDDVRHFLEEAESSFTTQITWLPRAYCSKCRDALGFEVYRGSKATFLRGRKP